MMVRHIKELSKFSLFQYHIGKSARCKPRRTGFFPALRKKFAILRWLWVSFNRTILMTIVIKVLLVGEIGESAYRTNLASIRNPSPVETFAKLVLHLDPLTLRIRELVEQIKLPEHHNTFAELEEFDPRL